MSWRTVWQRWLAWLNPWLGLAAIMPMDFPAGDPAPPVAPSRVYAAPEPVRAPSPARLPVPVPPTPFIAGPNVCEVCGDALASGTARTFDGHWRCHPHKAVTCDVCVRELAPSTLTDAPWVCARHG